MRKPVYLAVIGVSIVVAAGALGVTLTRYLGLRAYSPTAAARAATTPDGPGHPAPPAEEWNNLFAPKDGMKMASRLPANAKSASQGPRTAYLLVGTIVSSSPAARRAILWANGMKEPKAFREKEEVEPGAILSSVERDKAWITRGKDREKLEILPVGNHARATATAIPAVPPSAVVSPDTIPRSGPTASPPPPPDRSQAVAAPGAAPEAEEDEIRPRDRPKRSRGSRL